MYEGIRRDIARLGKLVDRTEAKRKRPPEGRRGKARTRFSDDDLKTLRARTNEVRDAMRGLSDFLLSANLAHTGQNSYDRTVRRVCDGLNTRLSGVDELLYEEEKRHWYATEATA